MAFFLVVFKDRDCAVLGCGDVMDIKAREVADGQGTIYKGCAERLRGRSVFFSIFFRGT